MSDDAWRMFQAMPEERQRATIRRIQHAQDTQNVRLFAYGFILGVVVVRALLWLLG